MKKRLKSTDHCTVCGLPLVGAAGPDHAPVVFVGEEPDKIANNMQVPLAGRNLLALQAELDAVGIKITDVRIFNLWDHVPPARTPKEYEWMVERGFGLLMPHKIVVLCGADPLKAFHAGPEPFLGLPTKSDKLRGKIVIPAPAMTAFAFAPIGELRFCLQTLAKEIKKR